MKNANQICVVNSLIFIFNDSKSAMLTLNYIIFERYLCSCAAKNNNKSKSNKEISIKILKKYTKEGSKMQAERKGRKGSAAKVKSKQTWN